MTFHDDPRNPQTCEVFEEWYHDPCPCKAEKPAEVAPTTPAIDFLGVILREMTRQGLNKAQLAAKMGVTSQQLYRVFRPGTGMTLGTMERMAAALGSDLKFQLVLKQLPLPLECASAYDISNGGLSRCPPSCPHCQGQPSA